ncbi:MAG: hypothetical protein WC881_11645, partial [Elusimicrobiota bacterium]
MISTISALLLSLTAAGASAASSYQDVYVKNRAGLGVERALVAAIRFSTNGPDSTQSQISTTDANGFVRLLLTQDYDYEIFASSHGFLPSIRDQFNNPEHIHVFPLSGVTLSTPTITISSAGAPGMAEVIVTVKDASPNGLIFGEIRPSNDSTQDALAFAMARTDAVGIATVTLCNLPYSPANSYNAGFFDPGLNRGVGRSVDQALSAGNPQVVYQDAQAVSFVNALAPVRTENQSAQSSSGVGSNISLDGVVVDTYPAANFVPWVGVSLAYRRADQYCPSPCVENRWVNSDDNGRFQLYGLQADTSYYVTTYSGCRWDGTCFQGAPSTFTAYESTYGLAYSTMAPLGPNDFFYGSTSTVVTKQLRLPLAPGGSARLAVYVKDQLGNAIPQSNVNLWPDHMAWETSGACAGNQRISNPGLATSNQNATTGYALSGLPSGNYRLSVWTQFSQNQGTDFNAGPNGQSVWDWNQSCGSDDLRLSIASDTLKANVYNSSGTALYVGLSSVTATVTIPSANTGLVRGTLTFPYG